MRARELVTVAWGLGSKAHLSAISLRAKCSGEDPPPPPAAVVDVNVPSGSYR